jgi:hypothetical protein
MASNPLEKVTPDFTTIPGEIRNKTRGSVFDLLVLDFELMLMSKAVTELT